MDRKRNVKILNKICLYPHILGKKSHRTRSTERKGRSEAPSFSEGLRLPQPSGLRNRNEIRHKSVSKPVSIPKEETEDRTMLFETATKLQGKSYFVEVSRSKTTMFIIVFSLDHHNYKTLTIPIKRAYELIQSCNNNFEELVGLLKMKNNILSIANKKSDGREKIAWAKTNESIPRYPEENGK